MIKNKSHLILTALFLYSGCQNKKSPTMSDLKEMGYELTYCDNIEYYDYKSDIAEDPYYKIYRPLEVSNPNLSILAARCFDEQNCIYELVENNEIVCQKYIVSSNEDFIKTWDEHKVLVFNTKNML